MSRLSLMWKKAEQPVRIGVKRRNRISFVPPFYGFLRLFTAYGFKNFQPRMNTDGHGAGEGGEGAAWGHAAYKARSGRRSATDPTLEVTVTLKSA
jgi:hypothetical protein